MRPEAGQITKTTQHRTIRARVTGAGMVRTALRALTVRAATAFLYPIMCTEHGVTGRISADRLAAVDTRAASGRQAVGLRAGAPGKLARHGH
ncbi:hypothetical protein GCM10014715_67230 [Streptomyces spiralis]|uniref:Uncharacterized protein n=1 Tax=Streptomyces spiralis TaxID=66376 RepID=A0A919AE16_9ACTN|nr:hypothetical protein GCM10014715_67230 [Streptomyces spiralis]